MDKPVQLKFKLTQIQNNTKFQIFQIEDELGLIIIMFLLLVLFCSLQCQPKTKILLSAGESAQRIFLGRLKLGN